MRRPLKGCLNQFQVFFPFTLLNITNWANFAALNLPEQPRHSCQASAWKLAETLNIISKIHLTMSNELKVRYSDEDLQEFKAIVDERLVQAQNELSTTEKQIADLNENGFNQQGGDWYDDSTAHTDLEMLQRMLQRQLRFVQDLKNALLRIQNKTYGICTVTGELIRKERLRLVPHATKSMDGKAISNSSTRPVTASSIETGDSFDLDSEDRPGGKPIGDKVRLTNGKRPTHASGDDWEIDNESMEDSGYTRRKNDDDDE